ncbi:MAG: 4'-phosphopantetheinyl transferase superfamily protein [Tannerella sp.]|nr:4'-phosphopantetheinyl transferase superfamily protein [Tannerella sp.]
MPVIQSNTSPAMAVWKITETASELMELLNSKDNSELEYIKTIKSETRKKEYLAVRLLLRDLTQKNFTIAYHPDGSPYLTNNSKLNISISHTKDYAAVILSEETAPGIDIEYCSPRAWKLKERFLSVDELKFAENENIATVFWCAKETAFKALKQENMDFIRHLTVVAFSGEENTGVLKIREQKTENRQIFTINYSLSGSYILTWTT